MERTLLIVKPDGTDRQLTGKIIARLEQSGFQVRGLKMIRLTPDRARKFYAVHEGKPFLDELVEFMSSAAIVPIALEKENAVTDLRALIGATDPKEAACGTIRYDWALDKGKNTVHGSDSPENGRQEVAFFFSEEELVG